MDGTSAVKLTDEPLNTIIPKNEDDGINIRLSEQPLREIAPNDVQEMNIVYIRLHDAGVWPDTYGEDYSVKLHNVDYNF